MYLRILCIHSYNAKNAVVAIKIRDWLIALVLVDRQISIIKIKKVSINLSNFLERKKKLIICTEIKCINGIYGEGFWVYTFG